VAGDGRRGTFITFEGGEGSGKSTVAEHAAARLREQGHDVLLTREPEGTDLGRHIWDFFRELAAAGKTMTAEAELFLFAAARAEHARTVVRPALESQADVREQPDPPVIVDRRHSPEEAEARSGFSDYSHAFARCR